MKLNATQNFRMSNLEHKRHSLAHLLAAAVLELHPDAKRAIGPAIENGFYYDFGDLKIADEDLPKIEATMRKILPTWKEFKKEEISASEAKKLFHDNPYKLELIEEYKDSGLTTYTSGGYMDLCRGGHSLDIDPEAFKLTHIAGAYWRGSEKNPMLTRIYGLAFDTKKALDEYLAIMEEAKKRDHKVLGPKLNLFMFHETAPGLPYWLPHGVTVMNELIDFWRKEHRARGYHEISSPLVNKKELWDISGHWEHYKDDMFIADMGEGEVYGLKPMNCPNAMVVFGSQLRSYKDLPLRFSDTDLLHRYERSGTLNGLLRARALRQDDSHNFVTEDQIEEEYERIIDISELFYGIFQLPHTYNLATRPNEYLGDIETWNKAEAALKRILDKKIGKGNFGIKEKDGAFYGPKIDIHMKDVLGREWQMGTIQLDFQQPRRFNLHYIAQDGSKQTPVAIHRVLYGSLERFLAILIEHFAGAFPLWLAPVQVAVLPISEKHTVEAQRIVDQLRKAEVRVELHDQNESIGKKIREAEMMKIPYLVILGDKEIEAKKIAVRQRGGSDLGAMEQADFVARLLQEIRTKAL